MPTYRIKDNVTGQVIKMTGDSPPSEQEVVAAFQEINSRADGAAHVPLTQTLRTSQTPSITEQLSTSKQLVPTGDPVIDKLLYAQKEVVGPIVQGANTLTFGVPRLAARMIGGEELAKQAFPEQSTTGGKIARFGAEAVGLGGGPIKAASVIGKRLIPRAVGLGENVARTALEGAITGAITSPKEFENIKQRGIQAGVGATIGAIGVPIERGLRYTARGFKKVGLRISKPYLDKIRNIGNVVKEKLNRREAARQAIEDISTASKVRNINATDEISNVKEASKRLISQTIDTFKDNTKRLSEDFNRAADIGAEKFRTELPKYFKNNSAAYGDRLDEITSILSAEGRGLSKKEVTQILDNTLSDISESFIPEGQATAAIRALKEKYTPKMIGEQSKFISARTGEPIGGPVRSDAEDIVDFNSLLRDFKNVKNYLSSGAKSGTKGFTPEDLSVQFLNNNLGDSIKQVSPEFAQLQESYSPIIQSMKEAHRIFKPNAGEFQTKTATTFLKRVGKGKADIGERKLLESLQKGSNFSQGIGDIASEIESIGKKIADLNNSKTQKLARLQSELSNKLSSMSKQRNQIKLNDILKVNQLKKDINNINRDIDALTQKMNRMKFNRDKAIGIIRSAAIGAGTLAAGSAASNIVGKIANQR